MKPHESPPATRREFLRETASLFGCAAALGPLLGILPPDFPVRFAAALRMAGGDAAYPIPPQDGATIDREHEAILVRFQERVYVFALFCPHQRTPLRWQEDQRRFQCPKHKSTFQPDGAFVSGRATRAMDRYPIRREGDTVVADLSTVLKEDKDAERWGQAVVQL
jgi:nitrite reductase/ring-hydroxylating ferredoxin subunit